MHLEEEDFSDDNEGGDQGGLSDEEDPLQKIIQSRYCFIVVQTCHHMSMQTNVFALNTVCTYRVLARNCRANFDLLPFQVVGSPMQWQFTWQGRRERRLEKQEEGRISFPSTRMVLQGIQATRGLQTNRQTNKEVLSGPLNVINDLKRSFSATSSHQNSSSQAFDAF